VFDLINPAFGQEDHTVADAHEGVAAQAHAEHGAFPPFDPATFPSQLLWLAITFGALYFLMSRIAVPQIGGILEARNARITGDLAEAGRLRQESEAALAAYEQALAEARQNAHVLAQQARDAAKTAVDADRRATEAALQEKLAAADRRIAEVKVRALAEVDAIARDATEAMVAVLAGASASPAEVSRAVEAAMAERA
jgi:F-type H+-transporting ATPase subunit b